MSFQAYLDNIQAKTGKSPDDLKALAKQKGFLQNGLVVASVKATDVTNWLKEEFDLGHGHCMAIWALFKGKRLKPQRGIRGQKNQSLYPAEILCWTTSQYTLASSKGSFIQITLKFLEGFSGIDTFCQFTHFDYE